MENKWRHEGKSSLWKMLEPQERAVGEAISHQSDRRKSRPETMERWVSKAHWAPDCDQMAWNFTSRNESLVGVWRNNNEMENEEWTRLNVGQYRPFGGGMSRLSSQRLSVSSDSSMDTSDNPLTPPPTAFQDGRQLRDIEGLSALKACYQQLLDLQTARFDYERVLGRSSEMIPVFEPAVFTKKELMELVEFSQIQFKSLNETVQAHEKILQPTDAAYLDTVWEKLCQSNNVHKQYAGNEVQNRKDLSAKSSTSTTVLCIQQLKNLMEAWKNFTTLLTDAIRKSIVEEGSMLFQESESVVILLQIFKTLVQDVQAQLVWGFCTKNLDFKNEDKENKPVHKMTSLPFRAEDPVQLPQLRFPPTRKQHCAPRYVNKNRK